MDEKKKDLNSEIDNLEVEPISDEDLESVAGGMGCSGCGSTSQCSNLNDEPEPEADA